MPTLLTIFAVVLSFIVTFFALPYWIKRAEERELVGTDLHKPDKRKVAELGGLVVVLGIIIGILFYIAVHVFIFNTVHRIPVVLAALTSILIATVVGLVDDILGWKIGLRQYQKPILSILIALPIMVINAGVSTVSIPFFREVDFGLAYPLFLVPLGIIGASNGFNMIAGMNGLEAGMGLIITAVLGIIAWNAGATPAALIAACTFTSIFAFLYYNKNPARVFPGNTFTYTVGTAIAIIAIIGNMEKFALAVFIPYFIELFLKWRGRFQKESFAKMLNGNLVNRYLKWYSLNHFAVSAAKKLFGTATEQKAVLLILGMETVIGLITIIAYFMSAA